MTTRKLFIPALAAMALLTAFFVADEARAGIRIDARVSTPVLTVRVGHGERVARPAACCVAEAHRRHGRRQPVMDDDRRIASRLSRYHGVEKRSLMRLRHQGLCWHEVGREYGMRPAVVRAAFTAESWAAYLRHHRVRDLRLIRVNLAPVRRPPCVH